MPDCKILQGFPVRAPAGNKSSLCKTNLRRVNKPLEMFDAMTQPMYCWAVYIARKCVLVSGCNSCNQLLLILAVKVAEQELPCAFIECSDSSSKKSTLEQMVPLAANMNILDFCFPGANIDLAYWNFMRERF